MSKVNKTVSIMDIPFLNSTKQDLLDDHLMPCLLQEKKCFIVTANPEIVMKAREDAGYMKIIQAADYVVPDGAGILLAAKYMKDSLQERIAGYDLMMDLLKAADVNGLRCYFLGARAEINERAVRQVREKFPNIEIVGNRDGFFDMNDKRIAEDVKESAPDLVFVALGLPRQEEWIMKYYSLFPKGLFMGVGGSFDVLAGEVNRAPQIWIKLNLEWLYRLIKQPFRLKRIFKVFEFMGRIILKKDR